MGAGAGEYGMPELFRDSSSQKMQAHQQMIKTMVDRGYEIESQEADEDRGAEGELVSQNLTTVLKPVDNFDLPMLKFVAKEEFGRYFDAEEQFYPHDEPIFVMKAFKKGADIKSFRDPWQPFDMA